MLRFPPDPPLLRPDRGPLPVLLPRGRVDGDDRRPELGQPRGARAEHRGRRDHPPPQLHLPQVRPRHSPDPAGQARPVGDVRTAGVSADPGQ